MNVEFHNAATSEVQSAIAFHEAERSGLGRNLWDEILAAVQRIELNPDGPERIGSNLRRTPIRRFPYSIIYGICRDTLWIVAVAHHSRQAAYWRNRVL